MRKLLVKKIQILHFAFFILHFAFISSASAVDWWNGKYHNRRQLTISTGAYAVPKGYVVRTSFDTSSLVTAGKIQSDRKDLRIVYWDGSKNVQLDRDYVAVNETWFKLQTAIAANSSDSNYYIYYDAPQETDLAPSDLKNIYTVVPGVFSRPDMITSGAETDGVATYLDPIDNKIKSLNRNIPRFVAGKFDKGILQEQGVKNLIPDSSFETSEVSSGSPRSWLAETGIGAVIDNTRALNGTYSAKVTNYSTTTDASFYMLRILTSTPHVASAYVYYDGTNPISVCSIFATTNLESQLTYAVNSSTSIIVVTSTTNFPATNGYLKIDNEIMQYTSVTTTSFLGVVRGSSGTTAATHAATASVSYDVPVTTYSVPIVNGWYRIFAYFTGVTNVMWFCGVKVKKADSIAGRSVWVDCYQLERDWLDSNIVVPRTSYVFTDVIVTSAYPIRSPERLAYPTNGIFDITSGSISMWINPRWTGSDGTYNVLFSENVATDYHQFIIYRDTDNRLYFAVWGGPVGTTQYSAPNFNTAGAGWTGYEWHNIVIKWWDRYITLYVDGVKAGTGSNTRLPEILGPYIYIGGGKNYNVNAIISDFALYKFPISDQDVLDIYTKGTESRMYKGASFFANFKDTIDGWTRPIVTSEPTSFVSATEELNGGGLVLKAESYEFTYPEDSLVKISIPTGTTINGAIYYITKLTSPPVGSFEPSVAVTAYEFSAYDNVSNALLKNLNKAVTITLHCKSYDGFIIANSNPVVLLSDARTSLTLAYWNGMNWIPIGGTISISGNDITISSKVTQLGKYAIVVNSTGKSVELEVSPNPFTPLSSNSNLSIANFSFLNNNYETAEVKIWNITGDLIRVLSGSGTRISWSGEKEDGSIVESGVYIYQIKLADSLLGKGTIIVAK
ncbi:MAG: LamG domain-containing protein [Candidatus Firestonebacteria bacterium]